MTIFLNSPLLLLFVGGIMLALGDIAMKEWIKVSSGNFLIHTQYYLLGLFVYGIGLTLFAFSLKSENIAVASIIIIFFNILIVLLIGHFFFGEHFSMMHFLGILLGLASVVVLEYAG